MPRAGASIQVGTARSAKSAAVGTTQWQQRQRQYNGVPQRRLQVDLNPVEGVITVITEQLGDIHRHRFAPLDKATVAGVTHHRLRPAFGKHSPRSPFKRQLGRHRRLSINTRRIESPVDKTGNVYRTAPTWFPEKVTDGETEMRTRHGPIVSGRALRPSRRRRPLRGYRAGGPDAARLAPAEPVPADRPARSPSLRGPFR